MTLFTIMIELESSKLAERVYNKKGIRKSLKSENIGLMLLILITISKKKSL